MNLPVKGQRIQPAQDVNNALGDAAALCGQTTVARVASQPALQVTDLRKMNKY